VVVSKLDDVSDALSSMQLSSCSIPDELCIEGTHWLPFQSVTHSLIQLIIRVDLI